MKLITVQPPAVMLKLVRGQHVYGIPDFELDADDPDKQMRRAYDWLVGKMTERVGPHPYGVYPMWAWAAAPEGVEAFIPVEPGEFDFVIELEVPDHMVVCTCYDMWHHVLNRHSIQLYEDEEVGVEASWDRVFGVDPKAYAYTLTSIDPSYMNLNAPPTIQATLWYIDPEWITSVTPVPDFPT